MTTLQRVLNTSAFIWFLLSCMCIGKFCKKESRVT